MEESENTEENGPNPKKEDSPSSLAKSCALCGCSTPAVRCDRCSSQIFCLSCDDMYHRHPKRRLHLRKAVDSIWSSSRSPRLRRRTDLPGDPSKIPIPPPRSKKRERHTIGGRLFLKPGLELGSFGHSKVFDMKSLTPPKDMYAKPKLSANAVEETYENEAAFTGSRSPNIQKTEEIYENDTAAMNQEENRMTSPGLDQSPWNSLRSNLSPIQVSIPSSTPEFMANGQPFGFPPKSQSRSITDLSAAAMTPGGQHTYHYPHPYPYMHPPIQPPYSHSMAHLNCAQCMSSSWSNLMSPHPSPYFHPMPWGSPQASLGRNGAPAAPHGQLKHSHGDLGTYPDPNFHFPYPGGVFYPNGGLPVPDPNIVKDMSQQSSGTPKVRRSPSSSRSSRHAQSVEDLESPADASAEASVNQPNDSLAANAKQSVTNEDEPKVPVAPSKPWSCLHCTYINPPGIYICQVCCKTSYGNKPASDSEDNRVDSPMVDNRNSESPMELVNMDAEIMSSEFSKLKAQKVI